MKKDKLIDIFFNVIIPFVTTLLFVFGLAWILVYLTKLLHISGPEFVLIMSLVVLFLIQVIFYKLTHSS